MEILVLDGKNYVKASKAARELGYAADYVGQLCRSGQIDAHLIGRTWYVNQDELGTHKTEKKRISRIKAREYAKKSIEEHRVKINQKQNVAQNIDIQYESDHENLIPEVRKLSIETAKNPVARTFEEVSDFEKPFSIENGGKKVVMSGALEVIDVTDGEIDADTTILTPTRIRHRKVTPEKQAVEDTKNVPIVEESEPVQKLNFLARLEKNAVIHNAPDTVPAEIENEVSYDQLPRQYAVPLEKVSWWPLWACLLILVALGFISIGVKSVSVYDSLKRPQTVHSIVFSLEPIIKIIRLKI